MLFLIYIILYRIRSYKMNIKNFIKVSPKEEYILPKGTQIYVSLFKPQDMYICPNEENMIPLSTSEDIHVKARSFNRAYKKIENKLFNMFNLEYHITDFGYFRDILFWKHEDMKKVLVA